MKIGIDIRTAIGKKAGIGAYTEYLVLGLSEIDRNNKYVLYTSKPVEWELGDNFEQIIWDDSTFWGKLTWQLRLWLEVTILGKVDVFLSTNSVILALLSVPRRNVVLTIHDMVPFLMRETTQSRVRFWFMYLPLAAKFAKAIIVPSEATRDDVIKHLGISRDKIFLTWEGAIIPKGKFKKGDIEKVKKKFGIQGEYFLFISTLEPRKNIPNLIRAFSKFSKDYKKDIKLVIGGKKGWLYDEIFQVVQEENVENKVIFTDYVPDEDMEALHKGAIAYVNIPLMEGFGLSQLVAMTWEVPVLTSNMSSIPEVVGDAAITVDPNDISLIAKKMLELAEDEELRAGLKERGLKQASKFSWQKTAKLTLNVLEKECS